MRWVLTMFVIAGLTTAAIRADETKDAPSAGGEGAAVLEKAREAMKGLKSVRYKVDYRGTGWLVERVPTVSATVLLAGQSQWKIDRFHFEGTLQPPKTEQPVNVTAGCDGDLYFLVHNEKKTVYEDIDTAVLGSFGRSIPRAVLSGFTSGDPLADEGKAEKFELKEPQSVEGESCDQVLVTMSGDRQVIWYISQKDHLPRRYDRLMKDPEKGSATTELVVSRLELNPKVEGNPFKAVVPEGFTKSDQFAP